MDVFNNLDILKPKDSTALEIDSFTQQRMGICDLVEDVLEIIFDFLSVSDLKNVSLVCVQWSRLAFSGRRMDRIRLIVFQYMNINYSEVNPLKESQRRYSHITFGKNAQKQEAHMECIQFLQRINKFVVSLDVAGLYESSQIKSILQAVPNVKVLSMNIDTALMQLPVLRQLSELIIPCWTTRTYETLDICIIAPNLQKIYMACDSDITLKVYRHFSLQLKKLRVFFGGNKLYLDSFCEISFPELLDIEVFTNNNETFSTNHAFLAASKHLQRAILRCIVIQPIVNSLVENCRALTYLHISMDNLEYRSLNGLANLTKLKTLVLCGNLNYNIFDKRKPIPSLQELDVWDLKFPCGWEFIAELPMTMPHVSKLRLKLCSLKDAQGFQFICNNYLSLKCLTLNFYYEQVSYECVKYLDRLSYLFELSLESIDDIDDFLKSTPLNKVNVLSFTRCRKLTSDGISLIPQVFPSLHKLKISECPSLTSRIEELRDELPQCIIMNEKFEIKYGFYRKPL